MNRSVQEVVGIHTDVDLQARRQYLFCFFQQVLDIIDGFRRIGSCHLINDTSYGTMTVYFIDKVISQTSQFDIGDIFHTEHFTIRQSFHNHVLKFVHFLQTSLITDRILETLVTLFTKRTRSGFHVLLSQDACNVIRNQFILCHHIRLQPDTHGIVCS